VWTFTAETLPADAATVWCRFLWEMTPVKGTWSVSGATFTLENGLVAPWWVVKQWRTV